MAAGNVFANRYELVRELARGGMAEVFLARDTRLDRPVAVKVLTAELSRDPTFVERFRLEAQAAANLNDPNIVSVYDWGQEQGTSFIVMEYVEGQTLRDVIRTEGTIAPARVADIGADIAAALAFAHRGGVVHRDVKPGNVLITPTGQVKVTDFGIARADGAGGGLTRTGAVMGTATYFSPEQAQGLPVDGRSDVYSLGVVLYEMLTGAPPFAGDNPVTVAYQHVREPIPRPSDRVAGIPPALEQVVLACLEKDPLDRYQSADDLRADLLRFRRGQELVGAPVTAAVAAVPDATATMVASAPTRPTTRPAAAPPKKRGRGPVIAVAVIVAVLIGALAFALFGTGNGGGGPTVEVPDVVGRTEAVARTQLVRAGFEVDVRSRPNATQPAGIVVSQDPGAGEKVAEGSTVTLVVSAGQTVRVPDVTGQTFEDAQATLEAAGLQVARQDQPSDSVDAGRVIRTSPKAKARVDKGSDVIVFVSAGPAPVAVPDVVGLDQVEATQQLNDAGFKVTKTTAASSSVPSGSVISTQPAAGTQAQPGTSVRIVVSTGPEQVMVPNVVGQSESSATNTLSNLGFDVTVVEVSSSAANDGLVIAQNPSAGTSATKGSGVTITVGTGPPGTTTTATGP